MTEKEQEKAQEVIGNVLLLLGVESDQYLVSFEADDSIQVQISLPEDQTGVFIGHRGDTISSLQLILSLTVNQRLGDWHRLRVNIGDYQERRLQTLLTKADQAAQKALATGQEIILPNLNAYERQLIHSHLSENPDVVTESRGTDPYRQLFILPKLA